MRRWGRLRSEAGNLRRLRNAKEFLGQNAQLHLGLIGFAREAGFSIAEIRTLF